MAFTTSLSSCTSFLSYSLSPINVVASSLLAITRVSHLGCLLHRSHLNITALIQPSPSTVSRLSPSKPQPSLLILVFWLVTHYPSRLLLFSSPLTSETLQSSCLDAPPMRLWLFGPATIQVVPSFNSVRANSVKKYTFIVHPQPHSIKVDLG